MVLLEDFGKGPFKKYVRSERVRGYPTRVRKRTRGQSAFHALRPEDLRRALRFFSACGVQTNEKTFGVRNLFSSWPAKLYAARA